MTMRARTVTVPARQQPRSPEHASDDQAARAARGVYPAPASPSFTRAT